MAYNPGVRFEWDPAKAEANRRKHGVSFEAARSLLTSGVDYLEIYDDAHSGGEDRYLAIGPTARGAWSSPNGRRTPSGSSGPGERPAARSVCSTAG